MMLWNNNTYLVPQSPCIPQLPPNNGPWSQPYEFPDVEKLRRTQYADRPSQVTSTASSIRGKRSTARSAIYFEMPPKRTSSGSPSGTPVKIPKTELKPEDFSNSVKKRLQSSTRTGQACDRCKVRPICFPQASQL